MDAINFKKDFTMRKYRQQRLSHDSGPVALAFGNLPGSAPRVQRNAGKFSNGLIDGPIVITRGEALGHGHFVDSVFLGQVSNAVNATGGTGAKARLGHPSYNSDGIGRSLGRLIGSRVEQDRVRAGGLHISKSSDLSPDGRLGDWVLSQAEEDPEAFGLSIDFEHNYEAEVLFLESHGAEWDEDDLGRFLNLDNFISPDPLNTGNLPHFRLAKLLAVDVVDSPAANPAGLLNQTSGGGPNVTRTGAVPVAHFKSVSKGTSRMSESITTGRALLGQFAGAVCRRDVGEQQKFSAALSEMGISIKTGAVTWLRGGNQQLSQDACAALSRLDAAVSSGDERQISKTCRFLAAKHHLNVKVRDAARYRAANTP